MADSSNPVGKPSFLSTMPGMLTAFGTAVASVTALVTALYTAGVIGHKNAPAPVPAPVSQSSGSAPAQRAGVAANGSEARNAQRQAAVNAIDEGEYSLRGYQLKGTAQPATGKLSLQKEPNGALDFNYQVATGGQTHSYQGKYHYRNGEWHQKIDSSDDSSANKTPVAISITKENGILVVKDSSGIEEDWSKQ